ncbi:unnamed protein product [Arabidopsis thaliana]|uniref:(thale cress) hypothetical protein n=1 Tax=Arabidopsis thaliana TaxID=3702 RepID=A0A7G2FDM8_ARATH|nr:unnamed protein product [Arabidopsis thaliana]
MAEEKKNKKKKSDAKVDSEETGEEFISEHSSMKDKEKKRKKKNKRENKDGFTGEDMEITGRESEKLGDEVVRGKRFTKEEDEMVKNAVLEYIDNHALGDEGIKMVMECKAYPQLKGCWKEITSALPWRTYNSVYHRAHTIFEAGSQGIWTKEDIELVMEFQKTHGNDWKTLADAMGKHRKHVKDAWRRGRLAATYLKHGTT